MQANETAYRLMKQHATMQASGTKEQKRLKPFICHQEASHSRRYKKSTQILSQGPQIVLFLYIKGSQHILFHTLNFPSSLQKEYCH